MKKNYILDLLISSRNMLDRWIRSLEKEEEKQPDNREIHSGRKDLVSLVPSLRDVDSEALFRFVKPGDIIDAVMPMTPEKLSSIPENHRHRPYIVVKKENNILFAYTGTSNPENVDHQLSFYLSTEDYNVWKDGYIELLHNYIIEKDYLITKLDSLRNRDMYAVNAILDQEKLSPNNHPRFELSVRIKAGDVIRKGGRLYYIRALQNGQAEAYELTESKKSRIKAEWNGKTYSLMPDVLHRFDHPEMFDPEGHLTNKVEPMIRRWQSEKERREKQPKTADEKNTFMNDHVFDHPAGTIFRDAENAFIYLFSSGGKHYGIPYQKMKEEVLQLRRLPALKKYRKEGTIEKEHLRQMIQRLVKYNRSLRWMTENTERDTKKKKKPVRRKGSQARSEAAQPDTSPSPDVPVSSGKTQKQGSNPKSRRRRNRPRSGKPEGKDRQKPAQKPENSSVK